MDCGISHDLKTPLTYIKGYSALLLNEQYEWSKEEVISFIREMDDKGKHMEELIQDLSLVTQLNRADGTFPLQKTNQDIVEFTKEWLPILAIIRKRAAITCIFKRIRLPFMLILIRNSCSGSCKI